jgi:hypothetical protein
MTRDTDPDLHPPRERRSSGGVAITVNISRRAIVALATVAFGGAGMGGIALTRTAEAEDTAVEAKNAATSAVEVTEQVAERAAERHQEVKDKLDPTSRLAAQAATDSVSREDFERLAEKVERLEARRGRGRRALQLTPPPTVPAAVVKPLPPAPPPPAASAPHPAAPRPDAAPAAKE